MMKYIADFHIHSHYSIATSKELAPESLEYWAAIKGIKIVGTGDFTHPGWIRELKEKLEPAEEGLYKLKEKYRKPIPYKIFAGKAEEVRFLLTAEISNIYKKKGRTRKIHNVIFAPSFEAADTIQQKLVHHGFNISSDGRPILGLDARNLLELILTCSSDAFFIPAHIWTPWFSALGANSGFNSIIECYEDMADNIYAVETGLSSDPPMNWLCSFLDKYTLVSNSDAHSPEKLGRNANILNTEVSYKGITEALKKGDPSECLGTIDMFPQEGKYHYAGHMKCGVCWNPAETIMHKGICPVCGKAITNGVMNRVAELADRNDPNEKFVETLNTTSLPKLNYAIPLKEILAEIAGVKESTKQIANSYHTLISKLGSELDILLEMPLDTIRRYSNDTLGEAISRMRNGNVTIKHGFDGQYGKIRVFDDEELKSLGKSKIIFDEPVEKLHATSSANKKKNNPQIIAETKLALSLQKNEQPYNKNIPVEKVSNEEQVQAINHFEGPALVIAGPGTGKTYILTHRIVNLIKNKGVKPENILAVTFTNKAANEIKDRIKKLFTGSKITESINISTFHSFGLSVLKKHFNLTRRKKNFIIIDEKERQSIIEKITGADKKEVKNIVKHISDIKQNQAEINPDIVTIIKKYEAVLLENNCYDIDDLIFYTVRILNASPDILDYYRQLYKWILIDEYQDINLIQYQLVKTLMNSTDSNLFAIGDANQAIYGFRGADVKFIKQFVIDNPKATVYHLKQSYRCSDKIIKASDTVIKQIAGSSSLIKGINEGIKINIVRAGTEKSEAEFVARTIEKMVGGLRFFSIDSGISDGNQAEGTFNLSDFAILCRINKQFDAVEKALNDHSIPFQSIGDIPFFKQEPIYSIINFLKYCYSSDNKIIKEKLLKKKVIQESDAPINRSKLEGLSVRKTLEYIINLYFRNEKNKDVKLIKQLLCLSDDFGDDINSFIDYTSIGNNHDAFRDDIDNVSLMTIHASKGLEFKCVFIIGCEDGLLPYSLFENQSSDIEEEKRLLYVGMTRAKTHLFLSYAEYRFLYGKTLNLNKSPFISKIEKDLAELISPEKPKKKGKDTSQLDLFQ